MYSVLYLFSNLEYRKSLEAKDKSIHKVSIRKKAYPRSKYVGDIGH